MKENALQRKMAHFNAQNANRFFINLDWLQVHVQGRKSGRFEEFETPYLKVVRVRQTQVFKNVFEIRYKKHNRVLATYATDALEHVMPTGHGILKVDNYYLYHFYFRIKKGLEWLLRRLDLEFIGITRLDISYDFNEFNNRRNPENFIKAFLRNDLVKLKSTKGNVFFEHDKENRFHAIRFGSKSSAVTYKMYNKSKEMKDETFKQHIYDRWKNDSGLDLAKEVWRLEFTINANTNLILTERSHLHFHSLDTLEVNVFAAAFKYLFGEYFDFRHNDRKQCRKDRMKPVNLLSFPAVFENAAFRKNNPFKKDSDRATKIFIKKLHLHQDEMRGKDDDFAFDARAIVSKLISVYGLQTWAEKKGIDFDALNYVEDFNDTQKAYL